VWTCILRTSLRRAWLTLSMAFETAWRRPEAIRQAFTLALMHKHFYEYVREMSWELEALIRPLRESPATGPAITENEARRWMTGRDWSPLALPRSGEW
jgi:hypothetical protein